PDGSASVTVQGSTKVPVGRVFTSGIPAQAQIVAGSSESATTVTAKAMWPKQRTAGPAGGTGGEAATMGELSAPVSVAPAAAGAGVTAGAAAEETPDGERLAVSGSSAATPVIASLAVGLVVLGGMVVLLLRKRPLEDEEGGEA
ncbi:LAETG motif-containing sortase-dependent surface protein, partial [Streptomyces goshikiensis]